MTNTKTFYTFVNLGLIFRRQELVSVVLEEQAKRWKVIEGHKHLRGRKFINKSEWKGFKLSETKAEACYRVLLNSAEDVAYARGRLRLEEDEYQRVFMIAHHHGIEVCPLAEVVELHRLHEARRETKDDAKRLRIEEAIKQCNERLKFKPA